MSKALRAMVILTLILVVAFGSLVPYAVSEDYWSHVTGCITVNGEPRGGVEVSGFGLSTTTDNYGNYRLNPMPATNGCIIASFHGHSSQGKQLTTPNSPPYPEVNLDIIIPQPTPTPTLIPIPTGKPAPNATPTATLKPSVIPRPTVTPTTSPNQTDTPTPPPLPTITPTSQPTATATVTPTVTPAVTPTTPTATPVITPAPSITPTTSPTNTVEPGLGYVPPSGTVSAPQWDHFLAATPVTVVTNNTTVQKNTTSGNVTDAGKLDTSPGTGTGVKAPAWNPGVNSKHADATSPGQPVEIAIIGLILACVAYLGFVAYSVIRKG